MTEKVLFQDSKINIFKICVLISLFNFPFLVSLIVFINLNFLFSSLRYVYSRLNFPRCVKKNNQKAM